MRTYKVTVDNDGTTRWFNEAGQLHREDGPAIELKNGDKEYFLNGKRHRENGPAVEYSNGYKEYWLNGKMYFYGEWQRLTSKTKELTVKQISDLLGYDVKIIKG